MIFEDFITIEYVSTFMGTVVVTMLGVQFLKELPKIKPIPTKYFTFIVAFVNIFICTIIKGDFSLRSIYLTLVNAMMVTFTATGGYDFTIGSVKFRKKNKDEKENKDKKINFGKNDKLK